MKKINITYETLYELFGRDEQQDSDGVKIKETIAPLYVKTPNGEFVEIQKLIKKPLTEVCGVTTESGKQFDCATGHLFQDRDGNSVRAEDADYVQTTEGLEKIVEYEEFGEAEVFDISIPAPHWYTSPNGIIHHNSYLSYGLIKNFLDNTPDGRVILFDSEIAIDKNDLKEREIDTDRLVMLYPTSLQEFRTQAAQIISGYSKLKKSEKIPLMFVLDSLSNMPSKKELDDAEDAKDVADMTRAKTIRSIFRILAPLLGKHAIPMVVTNHTYDNIMSMYGGKEIAGGGGMKFAASTIIQLSKAQDKDSDNTLKGLILTATLYKSRFTKTGKKAKMNLDFSKGLSKYYGLLEIAEKYDIFPKVGNKFETPEGKFFGSVIYKQPERFFTDEILIKIDEACKKEFLFGSQGDDGEDYIDDEEFAEENE